LATHCSGRAQGLYGLAQKHVVRGNIHHFGTQSGDFHGMIAKMKRYRIVFEKDATDLSFWKDIMVTEPDASRMSCSRWTSP
jgi:hypothetical protein